MKNKYLYAVILSLVAFFVSSYLTILHYQDTIPPCTFSGCEVVLTSKYSEIFGIPVSLMGAVFYGVVLAFSTLLLTGFKIKYYKIYLSIVSLGIMASSYFLLLQVAIIKEFCQYCLITEICSLLLFLIGVSDYKKIKVKEEI